MRRENQHLAEGYFDEMGDWPRYLCTRNWARLERLFANVNWFMQPAKKSQH